MSHRGSRRAIPCALLATTFLGSPAFAQVASPTFRQIDANGVDLVQGDLVISFVEGSIGSGSGELKLLRLLGSNGTAGASQWDGILLNYISGNGTFVDFGTRHDTFPGAEARGATLSGGGSSYYYTAPNGTVIAFQNDQAGANGETTSNLCMGGDTNCLLYPSSITSPDGKTVSLAYDYWTHCFTQTPPGQPKSPDDPFHCDYVPRLKSVTNNQGYGIVFNYADARTGGTSNPPPSWYQKSGANLYNNVLSPGNPQASVGYSYPVSGETDVTDMGGRVWRVTSSPTSLAVQRPGASSNTSSYNLSSGKVTSATIDGVTTNYSRNVVGSIATMTVTDALSHSKIITSDLGVGRPSSVQDEVGQTTSFQYDSSGRLTRTTFPEGNYSQLTYDGRGNVTQIRQVAKPNTGLLDIVTTATFDPTCANPATCNQPNSTTDAKGNQTDYTYDATHGGGLLTVTRPAAPDGVRPQTRYSYALTNGIYLLSGVSACQTASSCTGPTPSADETKATIGYDANANVASVTRADGTGALTASTTMAYDAMGNLLTVTGPIAGAITRYRYDSEREVVGVTSPDPDGDGPLTPRAVRLTYRPDGQVSKEELGTVADQSDTAWGSFATARQVDIGFDSNGRAISGQLSSGGTAYTHLQNHYDALGRVDCTAVRMNAAVYGSLPDACTLSTQGSFGPDMIRKNVYDAASRLIQVQTGVGTSYAANERTINYTNNGLVSSLLDGENNLTSYLYDGFDRPLQIQYPNLAKGAGSSNSGDSEQMLVYDANGNITKYRTRSGAVVSFGYDNLDRNTTLTSSSLADRSYSYDLLGRLRSATFIGSGQGVTNGYDALGRLTSSTTNVGGTARTMSYAYDLAGNRTQTSWWDGFHVNYDRLVTGETTRIRENGGAANEYVLTRFAYNSLGQRTSQSNGNGTSASWTYDAIGRLATLSRYPQQGGFALTLTNRYDPASRIVGQDRSNGNFTWTGTSSVNRPYASDGLNRYTTAGPASFTYDSGGNLHTDGTSTFNYDVENKLVSTSSGSTSTTLAYDPLNRLDTYNPGSPVRFIYDGNEAVADVDGSGNIAHRYVRGDGADELLVSYPDAGTANRQWIHLDERNSVIARDEPSGSVVANTYDEFGIPAPFNSGYFQYTGQLWLKEAGVQYSKARVYSPTLGRFLQTDPIGYGDGLNWYAYVHNDPINSVDPLGLGGINCINWDACNDPWVITGLRTGFGGGGGGGGGGGPEFGGRRFQPRMPGDGGGADGGSSATSSQAQNGTRSISRCMQKFLASKGLAGSNLGSVVFHNGDGGSLIAKAAFAHGNPAITIQNNVYVAPGHWNSFREGTSGFFEETIHSMQWDVSGAGNFLFAWALGSLAGAVLTDDPHNSPLEAQAMGMSVDLSKAYNEAGVQCGR